MDKLSTLEPAISAANANPDQEKFALAVQLFDSGNLEEAAVLCNRILSTASEHGPALHMLSLILAAQGRLADGLACIERAVSLDPQHPGLQATRGRILFHAGRFEQAMATLQGALERDPANPDSLHYFARCLQNLGRLQEAETSVRKALAARPGAPDLLDSLGAILLQRGDLEAARGYFEQALMLMDDHPGALANLALLHERNNNLDEAMRVASKGLALKPDALTLRLVMGRCLRRRFDYAAAYRMLDGLRDTGTPTLRRDAEYELALCADAMRDVEAAFSHASRANTLSLSISPQMEQQGHAFAGLVERLREQFKPDWVATWNGLSPEREHQSPAFLVGFPRSGTTLLDTLLGAHPQVRVLEECPAVQAMLDQLGRQSAEYPRILASLTDAQCRVLRNAYFQTPGCDDKPPRLLLDKSPFNTVHVGLIRRIFPEAPILLMVRHPCDVVLSCFMTNFELNSGSVHFTTLERSVKLYTKVMALWRTYTEVLNLDYQLLRYEDLIERPEQTLGVVTRFLGLPWASQMLEHVEHAKRRGHIRSASYAQVGRGLYRDALDRWQRYRKYLEPHMQTLQPYCEMFGYDI